MKNGQAIKEVFYILNTSTAGPIQIQPDSGGGCCFVLPALAEYSPTDQHFNDRHSVIWFFDELFSGAKIYLQKKTAGVFNDVVEMTDDSYGKRYPYGFFVNKFNEKAIGYQIEWTNILNAEGPGIYRFKCASTKLIGTFGDQFSFEFKLQVYTNHRADNTVRAEWHRNGELGSAIYDYKKMDYGILNWFNQIRIPKSTFGYATSEFTREFNRYPNGEEIWLGDEQIEELTWDVVAMPEPVHKFLRVDMFQSGRISITDYCKNNPTKNVDREVIPASNYAPDWIRNVMYANVSMKFNLYFQTLIHRRE